jgi:DNA-damage-inducible protein J
MKRQTSVRVDDKFYNGAKEVFERFGLSFSDAVNIFLAKVSLEKRIPFEIGLPSEELKQRVKNIENDENTQEYNKAEDLFKDLGI